MSSIGVFFSNLPFGIKTEELFDQLEHVFGEAISRPRQNGTLTAVIFIPSAVTERSRVNQKAVVSGIFSNFKTLQKLAIGKKINGKDICMNEDDGDERDKYGDWKIKLSAKERRERDRLRGVTNKKTTYVFRPSFMKEVNYKVFSGFSSTVHVNMTQLNTDILSTAGQVLNFHPIYSPPSMRVKYLYQLEALQAISLLNNNLNLCTPAIQFTTADKSTFSTCSRMRGIGQDGEFLDVNGLTEKLGYVPFAEICCNILNWSAIKAMQTQSHCWKCKEKFNFVGVDADLNFLVGNCNCRYDATLPIMHEQRAYFWPGETFTRLMEGQSELEGMYKTTIIYHFPMKPTYTDPTEYRDIVLPILQDNWKCVSTDFKKHNTTVGVPKYVDFVERLDGTVSDSRDVYSIGISVPKTKYWSLENHFQIKRLTISFNKENPDTNTIVPDRRKAIVKKLTQDEDNNKNILVFVQIHMDSRHKPILNSKAILSPKPIKQEFIATKQFINKWASGGKTNRCLDLILNPANPCATPQINVKKKNIWAKHWMNMSIKEMVNGLNPEQKLALTNAENSVISILQGPPGTGKTFSSAVIVTYLSMKEKGHILACAPSNFATDGLAQSIAENSSKFKLPLSVLRIYSKSREEELVRNFTVSLSSNESTRLYDLLHEEVRKSPNWLQDKVIQEIVQKIEVGNSHLLKQMESNLLARHIKKIEWEVMGNYDVFVATVGTLMDRRVQSFGKHHNIDTVLIDEAGQLTQPSALSLFSFNQQRTIIIGDHKQLHPQIFSYAAETSGLAKSVMEWFEKGIKNLSWVTLKEQHRMSKNICGLVSAVTYNNQLRNAENITARDIDLPSSVYTAVPELRSSDIVVFDHRCEELKMDHSYMNAKEVRLTFNIVQNLLTNGIPLSKVTILTLYDAQKLALKYKFEKAFGPTCKDITIVNVDGYQGRENSIVIVNCVRSNKQRMIGFSSEPNRLNVAISRAKFFLILVCNLYTFEGHKNQAWTAFLDELKKRAHIVSA